MSILQTATPILLLGIISSIITLNILKMQVFNSTNAVFNDISSTMTRFSAKIFDLSQNLMYDTGLNDILAFGNDCRTLDASILNNLLLNNPDVQAVKLVLDGNEYSLSQGKNSIYQYGSVGYGNIKNALEKSPANSIWYTLYQNNNTSDIFFARLIKNPYTGAQRGILFFQISNSIFAELSDVSKKYDNGQINVLSSNALPIVKNFDLSADTLEEIFSSKNGVISTPGIYYFCSALPDLGWEVIYRVDKRELYRILYLLTLLILILCLVSAAAVIFFTGHINRTIVMPIQRLSEHMRDWSENVVFTKPKKYEISEIDALYDDFRNMTQKITNLININYKATIVQKDLEQKMLQSQINPHFIFNTLEAINSFAIMYDATEISAITVAFSELIEHSIGYETNNVHTFEQELHLTDCYLTIIQIRFGNKITIIKDIDSSALKTHMPSLILQPIVENSVGHGIIPSGRHCELKIVARISEKDLVIKVTDNGVGIEKDKLDELNSLFKTEKNSVKKSIGLINVNKRLKLLYGDEYHLKITSEPDKFTEVTVKVAITPTTFNIEEDNDEI